MVFGRAEEPYVRVIRVTNVMTKMHVADPIAFPRDARHAYYMSEVEYMRAIEAAEERGEHVSAIYHSHFGQACYLSQDDLAFAAHPLFPFPNASQLVVSLLGQRIGDVGIFEPLETSGVGFVGRRLEATPVNYRQKGEGRIRPGERKTSDAWRFGLGVVLGVFAIGLLVSGCFVRPPTLAELPADPIALMHWPKGDAKKRFNLFEKAGELSSLPRGARSPERQNEDEIRARGYAAKCRRPCKRGWRRGPAV